MRCMRSEKPAVQKLMVTSQEKASWITMDNAEGRSGQLVFLVGTSGLLPSYWLVKVDPDFHSQLSCSMPRCKAKNIVGNSESCFCSGFLNGEAIDLVILHLRLQIMQLSSMAFWTFVQRLHICRSHTHGAFHFTSLGKI